MKIPSFIFFLALIAQFNCAKAQAPEVFEKHQFSRNGQTLLYRIAYPGNYSAKKKYPVLLFMHGSGERGNNNESQLKNGGNLFSNDSVRKTFPVIVIFPQCPADSTWNRIDSKPDSTSISGRRIDLAFRPSPTTPALLSKLLLDSLVSSKLADPKKMYVGGLSLGGFGTFDTIERYPDFYAAAIPICGGGDTTMASKFAGKTSVWMFHGDADKSVDVRNSREYYAALLKRKADVRYTEYPGVGHNSWDKTFTEKDLLPWLLTKSKK
jgi:predicted peptidase